MTLELVSSALVRQGFEVAAASDGDEVTARCDAVGAALVLCGADVPGTTPSSWVERLKEERPQIRVILLAPASSDAHAQEDLREQLGCDAVLASPFRTDALERALSGWGLWSGPTADLAADPMSFAVPLYDPFKFVPAPLVPAQVMAGALSPDASPAAADTALPVPLPVPFVASVVAPERLEHDELLKAPTAAPPTPKELELDAVLESAPLRTPAAPKELELDAVLESAPPPAAAAPTELELDAVLESSPPATPAAPKELELDAVLESAPPPAPAAPTELELDALLESTPPPAPKELELDAPSLPSQLPELELDAVVEPRAAPPPAPPRDTPPPSPVAAAPASPVVAPAAATKPLRSPAAATAKPTAAAVPGRAPARTARPTLPPSLAPAGDLATAPLPRMLFELFAATYSGVIRLSRKGVDRSIDLWGGVPVHITVEATAPDTLGQLLLSHGRITEEQLSRAVAQSPRRVGRALVEAGVIDDRDLLDALREQTERRIAATFAWRDGRYRIEPRPELPQDLVVCEVHPLSVIWRGVAEHYDLPSLLTYFHPLRARYVVATSLFPVHYERIGPFLRNLKMVGLLDGKTTVEAALRSDDRRALELAQALYVLLVSDMVRVQAQPGLPLRLPEAAPASAATKLVDYRELTRACDDIARAYLKLKESDPRGALGVTAGAPAAEVEAAFSARVAPFLPANLLPGLPDDVQRRAADLVEALEQARDTLLASPGAPEAAAARPSAPAPSSTASSPRAAPAASAPPSAETAAATAAAPPGHAAYTESQRLLSSGDFKGAQRKAEQAIAQNNREPNYWVGLARVLVGDKSLPAETSRHGALNCLRQAFGLDPTHVGANLEMARIFAQLGQKDQAKQHLTSILQQKPEHQEARRLLASL